MRIIAVILFCLWALVSARGDENLTLDTKSGKVKKTSSNAGSPTKPINFADVTVAGLSVSGSAITSLTATAPIIVTPSPIIATGTISIDPTAFQPLDADLTSLAAASGSGSIYYRVSPGTWAPISFGSNVSFVGGVLSASAPNMVASSKLLGSSALGGGLPPQEITLGTNLSMSGTTLNATGSGGGAAWGTITGTLSAQTDLQTALDGKQPLNTNLTTWATKTPYAGSVVVTTGKTFTDTNNLTLSGTDGSTLNVSGGGTLGTAAFTASTAYQAADTDLTTWAGLTPSANFQTMVPHTFAQIKTDLGLTIGTNVEAWSANLDAWSAIATSTKQAADTDLDTWAGITPVAAVGTWIAAPSSANLRGAMTDENGTGALLFNGATSPDFTTGITIAAGAGAGKILQGNGTVYTASTATWPTTAGTAGYTMRSDGTNIASYPQDMLNSSVATQGSIGTADTYLVNSLVQVAAGDFKAKGQYRCLFDMAKTAGTGAIVISIRAGSAGGISDPAILTFTFGAGTSVADTGVFEVITTWRTVGTGTSAVMQGVCRAQKNAATTTGLWNNTGTDLVIVAATSSGFNSSTATSIGVSFNGSTAFSGTSTLVQATLVQ